MVQRKPIIKVKATTDKIALLNAIREVLSKTELPQQLRLEEWSLIVDVPKFFESHLAVIEHQCDEVAEPCADRLKKALSLLGIDIKEIAKTIKKL